MLDKAIAELQKTLAISPRKDNALRRIAETRTYQGRYQDGLKILSQVDPDANPPYWHYQMALLLLHPGRQDAPAGNSGSRRTPSPSARGAAAGAPSDSASTAEWHRGLPGSGSLGRHDT